MKNKKTYRMVIHFADGRIKDEKNWGDVGIGFDRCRHSTASPYEDYVEINGIMFRLDKKDEAIQYFSKV